MVVEALNVRPPMLADCLSSPTTNRVPMSERDRKGYCDDKENFDGAYLSRPLGRYR